MKYFIYKFSPENIGIVPSKDLIVLAPSNKKETYISIGFSLDQVMEVNDFSFKNLFYVLDKEERIDDVFTLDEDLIIDVGILNEYFCSEYRMNVSNMLYKDKYLMRSALNGCINQPDFLSDWSNAEIGMLVKPRRLDSSRGIFKIEDLSEIKDLSFDEYIIENYVDYDRMITVDGLVANGKIELFFSHEYDRKHLEMLFEGPDCTSIRTNRFYFDQAQKSKLKRLYEYSSKVVEKLGNLKQPFPIHMEWFYCEDSEEFYFCEAACRFGGKRIPQLVETAFDINLVKEYWNYKLGLENKNHSNFIPIPSRISTSFFVFLDEKIQVRNLKESYNYDEYIQSGPIGESIKNVRSLESIRMLIRFTCSEEDKYDDEVKKIIKAVSEVYDDPT